MALSRLATSIAPSPTLRFNAEARRLKEQGEPVINLTVGEPVNLVPPAALAATDAVLKTRRVKYGPSSGLASLKKAILAYTEQNYGRAVSPANVIVSAGAKNSLYLLLYTLLDPGDEVILFAPFWPSYSELVKMNGGAPVTVTPAAGFHPTFAEFQAAVTPRTKAVLVNSPNNPSGAVYAADFIAAVVDFCEQRGLYVLMDDIYHQLVFEGAVAPSAYQFTPNEIDTTRVILINGISKTYGMTGFRIGWVVAGQEIVRVMDNVQGQMLSCLSPLLQAGAEGALTGSQAVVADLRQTMAHNRAVALRELQALPGVTLIPPQGAFYCFPNFSHYNRDSMALALFLLEKARVVTVPGGEFAMEGHLRLSFSGATEEVAEGIRRIRWALDPAAPREMQIGSRTVTRDWA